jgi:hypothetical protein
LPRRTPHERIVSSRAPAFTGAATTASEFFALLNGPQGGDIEIDVDGIGTENLNEIRAFTIGTRLAE